MDSSLDKRLKHNQGEESLTFLRIIEQKFDGCRERKSLKWVKCEMEAKHPLYKVSFRPRGWVGVYDRKLELAVVHSS